MKKRFLIYILFSLPILLFGQKAIKGQVVDKERDSPISDVIVQYGAQSTDYVFADNEGFFSIPDEESDSLIYFQSIGYKTISVAKEQLSHRIVVRMEGSPLSLSPVIISPSVADKILSESILNTKKNLLTGQDLVYLLHFERLNTSSGLKNQMYLRYTSYLDEKQLKKNQNKDEIPYALHLIDVRHVQDDEVSVSELYGAEYHASHLFTFGASSNYETTVSYSADTTLLILKMQPLPNKGGWATGEIHINRASRTLISMEIESVDSVFEKEPYKKYLDTKYKIVKKQGHYEFKKSHGKYYMSQCFTSYLFRSIDEYNLENEVLYTCDVWAEGLMGKKMYKKKKLGGYRQELFYIPDTTPKDFWNYPIDDKIEQEPLNANLASLNPSTDKPSNRLWRVGKILLVPAVLLSSLLLINR